MNLGGDAAEQVVRLSLEGMEVVAKITGEGAKNIALLLAAVLKEEHKTQGKARLSNMIKSGKELKVFSIQNKDLKKFSQEAKRYGVLYCALKDKGNPSGLATVDVIARAEDASKIQRIIERFELACVDKASVASEIQEDIQLKKAKETDIPINSDEERVLDDLQVKSMQKEENDVNPYMAETEKSPLSEPNLKQEKHCGGISNQADKQKENDIPINSDEERILDDFQVNPIQKEENDVNSYIAETEKAPSPELNLKQEKHCEGISNQADKQSIRKKLDEYKAVAEKVKEAGRKELAKEKILTAKIRDAVRRKPVTHRGKKPKER